MTIITSEEQRRRRLKRIEQAKFIVWMHTNKIDDVKERVRHIRAVEYLTNMAKKAPPNW